MSNTMFSSYNQIPMDGSYLTNNGWITIDSWGNQQLVPHPQQRGMRREVDEPEIKVKYPKKEEEKKKKLDNLIAHYYHLKK